MNKLQKQAAFEKMVTGLYTQGALSYYVAPKENTDEMGVWCRYRHDGKACSIGHLIEDEFYSPVIEGKGISSDNVKSAIRKSLNLPRLMQEDLGFFQRAQEALHDDIAERVAYDGRNTPALVCPAIIHAAQVFADVHHLDKNFLDDLIKVPVQA